MKRNKQKKLMSDESGRSKVSKKEWKERKRKVRRLRKGGRRVFRLGRRLKKTVKLTSSADLIVNCGNYLFSIIRYHNHK